MKGDEKPVRQRLGGVDGFVPKIGKIFLGVIDQLELPPPPKKNRFNRGDVDDFTTSQLRFIEDSIIGCFQKIGVYTPKSSHFQNKEVLL